MPDFHFVFGEPPDEIKEELERAHDQRSMAVTAIQHDVHGFLRELSKDQLLTLRALINGMSSDPAASAFFMGIITSLLDTTFGVCPCGRNHDEELAAVAGPGDEMRVVGSEETEALVAEESPLPVIQEQAKMDEYGLDYDEDGKLFCKNCGTKYVSIEDRMLKPPGTEGCSGCIQKSKWG